MDKVLVTGAAGFIGSHLVEACVLKGYDVRAFVRYNSKNDMGWLEHLDCKDDIEVVPGDIRDYDSVHNAMNGCHSVFHLAALIGIPYSYISPQAYIKTNIDGTYNILHSGMNHGVERIIVTSTSETYGTAQYVPMDENHPVVGQSPYSATKIAADQLAVSYYRSFDLPVKIVRPFNTYGPRQSARAIIPTIASQILSGRSAIKLGNLHPTRDYTYVKDTVQGFIEIAGSDKLYGEVTNIGTNSEISIGTLLKKIMKILDRNIELVIDNQRIRPNKSEVERLYSNNSKILEHTDWKPSYTIDQGLHETVEWIRDNLDVFKPSIYNI